MDIYVLAGLVKRLYPKFDIKDFSYRFKLQKFVFLLRGYSLDLGYLFSLYLKGPYSLDLTRDAFLINEWEKMPLRKFNSESQENKFKKFIKFIKPKKDDEIWLEGASTVILLKENNPNLGRDEIIKLFMKIKPKFGIKNTNEIYENLKMEGLI